MKNNSVNKLNLIDEILWDHVYGVNIRLLEGRLISISKNPELTWQTLEYFIGQYPEFRVDFHDINMYNGERKLYKICSLMIEYIQENGK